MVNKGARILVETLLKKAVRDMKDSPERSIRNLVDLSLHFSEGRYQTRFFETLQTMLQNENSPYYSVVRELAANVDSQRLVTLLLNLGYNGCTLGARRIRRLEETEGFNIPWAVFMDIDSSSFPESMPRYNSIISEGEELGIYTWFLFSEGNAKKLMPLIDSNRDSAFILFCPSPEVDEEFIAALSGISNLMVAVSLDEHTKDACRRLRAAGMPYSVYCHYGEADADLITGGKICRETQKLGAVFTGFISDPDCPDEVRERIYSYVCRARTSQLFRTVPWEIVYDNRAVDSIISNDACSAGFDRKGQLFTIYRHTEEDCFNLNKKGLAEILRLAFPKK
ncbi:MAG: hypothetical protein ACOX68_05905 [Candidatus Limivicinus sp.]|jgi:hypothetical protein